MPTIGTHSLVAQIAIRDRVASLDQSVAYVTISFLEQSSAVGIVSTAVLAGGAAVLLLTSRKEATGVSTTLGFRLFLDKVFVSKRVMVGTVNAHQFSHQFSLFLSDLSYDMFSEYILRFASHLPATALLALFHEREDPAA